jgi:hypothetical protein
MNADGRERREEGSNVALETFDMRKWFTLVPGLTEDRMGEVVSCLVG